MNLVIKKGLIDCYLLLYQPYTWCSNPRRKRSLAKDRDTVHTSTAAQGEKIPPPLTRVRARSRALTLPPPEAPTDKPSQWTSDQEWSLFFRKLPLELGQQIYRELLCQKEEKDILHLLSAKERLYHVRCTDKDRNTGNKMGWQHGCWVMYTVAPAKNCACNGLRYWHNDKLQAFPLTCRKACVSGFHFLHDGCLHIRS